MTRPTLWTLGGLLGIVAVSGTPVTAQQADTGRTTFIVRAPESAGLLRRLAEAADGYRTGERIWVVAARVPPYAVAGVFTDADLARRLAVDSNLAAHDSSRWGTYGPYVTPPDVGNGTFLIIVNHCRPTRMPCFPKPFAIPDTSWLSQDVDSISITAFHHSGARAYGSIRPDEVDAVFFSLAAIDKFVVPYYSAISGPAFALELRRSIVAQIHVPR